MKFLQQSVFLGLFLLSIQTVSAQDEWKSISIQGIGLETIKQMVEDQNGVYYHPKLIEKFKNNEKMANIDYVMLYYGFCFSESYNPYQHFALEDSLSDLTSAQKGEEAIQLADELLAENPISIFGNIEKAYALNALDKKQESFMYLERYRLMMAAMESSGEGSSYEKPIVVISPKDAQAILLKYKLIELSKSINGQNGHYYDVYLVKNKDGKQYPIYFDITIPRSIGMKIFMQSEEDEEK